MADPRRPSSQRSRPRPAEWVPLNEVRLIGRVTAEPVERTLPSGDRVVTTRIAVPRTDGRADALDLAAWSAAARRSLSSWHIDDVVDVEGSVRRRFWRSPAGPASRWEVEVRKARRTRTG